VPRIREQDFEAYETCILIGQIAQAYVPRVLEENPEFGRWYAARRGLKPVAPAETNSSRT
jgi:hypothetical protein